MEWKEFNLPNGIKVIYKDLPDFHSVSVGIWVKTGSRFEKESLSGVSHFIEHLLFKGTTKRNYRQIKEEIEGVGGSLNGFTSEEATCYWIKILGEYIDRSIDVLSDMLQNPLLKDTDIEKERNVIIEEINMYKDIPSKYVFEIFDSTLYSEHPLGQPIAGTPESMSGIKKENISTYIKNSYSAENIVVSISGNISEGPMIKSVERHLSSVFKKHKNVCRSWERKSVGPRINFLKKTTEQTHIVMGGLAPSRFDEKRYTLSLLNTILGGNMSSRLFNRIREKMGLAYAIKSFTRHYQDTGTYLVYAGVSPDKSEKSIETVIDEMRKMKDSGVKKAELERAKKFVTSQILMGLEDNLEYMMWLGEQKLFRDKPLTIKEIVEKINNVSLEQVKLTAEELFQPGNFCLSLIGPKADENRIMKTISTL
jgi:predicted Zn-dependent peptidase